MDDRLFTPSLASHASFGSPMRLTSKARSGLVWHSARAVDDLRSRRAREPLGLRQHQDLLRRVPHHAALHGTTAQEPPLRHGPPGARERRTCDDGGRLHRPRIECSSKPAASAARSASGCSSRTSGERSRRRGNPDLAPACQPLTTNQMVMRRWLEMGSSIYRVTAGTPAEAPDKKVIKNKVARWNRSDDMHRHISKHLHIPN
jgi:hypothetical protein